MRLEARVDALYLGDRSGVEKGPVNQLVLDLGGIVGDRHYGLTRKAGSSTPEVPRGTEIPNTRQWSAVSPEELALIAELLGIPRIEAGWLGANLCLAGIPNLT